ncbi:glycosyltransferase [Photobacterium damselae]|uniref:glycosyltransferase n=1 Tax=Photobacterium damselae TaxID=38293 RepID=UPI000D91C14D|nr:glycosyltransferase [Photobacterium damselae]NVO72621.1 glycosyltransferase [Photobacterium damselae subsp. damselae]SPY22961.1 Glycosyl transferases group 1 [Photobacterium damselae]
MKVVMVKYFFDTDANYQITEMAKVWPEQHELIIITTKYLDYVHKHYDDNQKIKDEIFEKKYGVKIIRLDCWLRIGTRVLFKKLKNTVDEISPDVLFIHGIGDFNDIFYLYGKNKYLTFRDCHMSWIASKNKLAKFYYKFYSFLFAPIINKFNKYELVYALGVEEKEYLNALGISNRKIFMLPHGYNKDNYYISSTIRNNGRKELLLSENDILITYTGKFDFSKLPHLNFNIYNNFSDDFVSKYNIKFLFIGHKNNEYYNTIFLKELDKFKYKDKVIILPGIPGDELVKIYNSSDICLWPKETTLSSIHAQVCGCKVIMENHTSNKERVIDNNNLFEINNIDDAFEKLRALIINKEIGNKIELSSIKDREYTYQVKKMLESWEILLNNNN